MAEKKWTDTQHYADIADAIRDKSGSTETMLPSEMAAAIAALPSGGGIPSPFTKFTSGTFTPVENIHDMVIEHGLGVIPDLVLIYPISGEPTAKSTNGILLSGREVGLLTQRQWYSYGEETFVVNAPSSAGGIYTSDRPNQGLKAATNIRMTICTHHGTAYYWCSDVTYRWLAFAQEGLTND